MTSGTAGASPAERRNAMAYRNGTLMKVTWVGAVLVFCSALLLWPGGSDAQEGGRGPRGKLSTPQAELLSWPTPPGVDKSYDAIDAAKLHGYVQEQAAISLKSRDAGNQFWGRIAGMPSGTETQNWIKDKFKAIGVPYETVSIPASADYPKSWGIDVSSNGKSIHLKSAFPLIDFPETAGSAERRSRARHGLGVARPGVRLSRERCARQGGLHLQHPDAERADPVVNVDGIGRARAKGVAPPQSSSTSPFPATCSTSVT